MNFGIKNLNHKNIMYDTINPIKRKCLYSKEYTWWKIFKKNYALHRFSWKELYLIWYRVKDLYYYIKCTVLPWRQYNKIKIRTLPPTWTDRDHVLASAIMQILTDYVEKELNANIIVEESQEEELRSIYKWWHEVYLRTDVYRDYFLPEQKKHEHSKNQEKGRTDCKICSGLYVEWNRLEEGLEKELDNKCKRIIELRQGMWT